jgi:FtsP/CotA-like multicopper oxidase with cupredoxin domain
MGMAAAAAALLALSACGLTKHSASAPASSAPSPAFTEPAVPSPTTSASAAPSAGSSASPSAGSSASPSESPGTGVVVHIDLVNGKAATEPKPIVKVKQGDTFTLIATSDKPLEIHIHGYDLKLELTPGQATTKSFVAAQQGTFEVEIENTSTHLFNLQVE